MMIIHSQTCMDIDSSQRLQKILKEFSPKRVFLVTGKHSYESSGANDLIDKAIKDFSYVRFHDFEINPKMEDVQKAIELFRKSKCDFVIGIGGGTVMDIAKAVAKLSKEKENIEDYLTGQKRMTDMRYPSVMIPTTAGTGSESTKFSVIYKGKTKYSLEHDSLLPDHFILDERLIRNLPSRIAAISGMDALSQAIESFWAVNSTDESREYSRRAIRIILENIIEAVNQPNDQSRKNMLLASHIAGQGINITRTTIVHSVSYPLTSYFDVPHGHAVALTLPSFIEFNHSVNEENLQDPRGVDFVENIMKELIEMLGVSSAREAKEKMAHIMKDIRLETTLSELGVYDIKTIVENGFNPDRAGNNPKKVTATDLYNLLEGIK